MFVVPDNVCWSRGMFVGPENVCWDRGASVGPGNVYVVWMGMWSVWGCGVRGDGVRLWMLSVCGRGVREDVEHLWIGERMGMRN